MHTYHAKRHGDGLLVNALETSQDGVAESSEVTAGGLSLLVQSVTVDFSLGSDQRRFPWQVEAEREGRGGAAVSEAGGAAAGAAAVSQAGGAAAGAAAAVETGGEIASCRPSPSHKLAGSLHYGSGA